MLWTTHSLTLTWWPSQTTPTTTRPLTHLLAPLRPSLCPSTLKAKPARRPRRQHSQWLCQLRRMTATLVSMILAAGRRHVTIVVCGTASRACLLPASRAEPRPSTCHKYVLHTQISRPAAHDGGQCRVAGPHYLGHRQAGAPPGMHRGLATGSQNTCLIHTLMQLVYPDGVWQDEVRRSILIRRQLEATDPMLRSTPVEQRPYLTFELHSRPVLTALGVRHEDFRVVCYTPHGAEHHGDGERVLSLWNEAFSHYVPLR